MKKLGGGKEKRAGKLIRISVLVGTRIFTFGWGAVRLVGILRILPRTKVRATDGHLDRSARLFLNAPLLSWAVSKVSRVLGFARGDQYFDRARHKFRRKKLCSPAHLDPFGPNIFFFLFIGREDNDPPALCSHRVGWTQMEFDIHSVKRFSQGRERATDARPRAISFHLWFFVKAAPISDWDKI